MVVVYWSFFILGLLCFEVNGRAVNISSAWFLPQDGFPVFYRYFRDKVTWNEAEAVCGFHHADILSVQTSSQMDAARAYLKEMDVTDNVWIGLQRESPEKPFSWTDGEKLLGDGYWLEPIPKTNEKLCAAIDPISDFRWNSFYCRGPQVASFVCELPVPDWAKKDNGCMITSLPSLTVTLIPEMNIIQLLSDCGLDGTRRIACKGGVNREEIIKRLSCDEDVFGSTVLSKSTTDTVNDINLKENIHTKSVKESGKSDKLQTQKSWESYIPQTRHRRDLNSSSPSTTQSSMQEEPKTPSYRINEMRTSTETSTQATSTQSRGNVLNSPTNHFPHSPLVVLEKNTLSTKIPSKELEIIKNQTSKSVEKEITGTKPEEKTITSIKTEENPITNIKLEGKITASTKPKSIKILNETTSVKVTSTTHSIPSPITPTPKVLQDVTAEPVHHAMHPIHPPDLPHQNHKRVKIENNTEHHSHPPNLSASHEIPVLIITSENVNDSTPATSENPQIVFMIDEKEGFAEPYLVPLNEDIIINNNPSISPMEVIDVDLVELENLTTTKTSSTSQVMIKSESTNSPNITPKVPHALHPLRVGVKNEARDNITSSTIAGTTSNPSTFFKIHTNTTLKPEVTTKAEKTEQKSQNVLEQEEKNEAFEIPQRPNRGRLLTHSNHPSFYPYFLNRVLG